MDHLPTHPFPYFKLPVTRDPAAIKKAVEEKYAKLEKATNNDLPSTIAITPK